MTPSLSPEAWPGSLLPAYDEMRELNSSYLGAEHVLLALARDTESDAGRLLARFGLSHTALRGAVIRGVTQTDDEQETRQPHEDAQASYSRDLTDAGLARASSTRSLAAPARSRRRSRFSPGAQEQPGADRRFPGVGKTAIAEGRVQRIQSTTRSPRRSAGKRLVLGASPAWVAGTRYRGELAATPASR